MNTDAFSTTVSVTHRCSVPGCGWVFNFRDIRNVTEVVFDKDLLVAYKAAYDILSKHVESHGLSIENVDDYHGT